jgi:hypothetical protein
MAYVRPSTGICANCSKIFDVGPKGRVPRFCRPACRTAACNKAKHGRRPSAEDRQRALIWGVLQDAGMIPHDKPLPPSRKAEDVA